MRPLLKDMVRQYWPVSLAVVVIAVFLINIPGLRHTIIIGIGMLIAIGATCLLYGRHLNQSYTERMQSHRRLRWSIHINSAYVGEIPDAELAALQQQVLLDERTLLAQCWQLGTMVFRAIQSSVQSLPLMLIWALLLLLYVNPVALVELRNGLIQADAASLHQAACLALPPIVSLYVLQCVLLFACGCRFGWENAYTTALHRLLRQRWQIAAAGELCLQPRLLQ